MQRFTPFHCLAEYVVPYCKWTRPSLSLVSLKEEQKMVLPASGVGCSEFVTETEQLFQWK